MNKDVIYNIQFDEYCTDISTDPRIVNRDLMVYIEMLS